VLLGAPGYFGGAYRDGCEIIGRARSEKKELVVVDGWSHYDLYEKPEPVAKALARMIPFYKENLGVTQSAQTTDSLLLQPGRSRSEVPSCRTAQALNELV
jgi:hypothetical protein